MTNPEQRLIVTDLDGTLLHDAPTFEERFITQRSIDTVKRMHDAGYRFAVATARPVSTGFEYAGKLPVDAYIYLNGALIDFAPERSDYDLLTSGRLPSDGHLLKVGFSSARACEVCRYLLDEIPGLSLGIVMDDVRYTNFDVSVYWKTQTWQFTDFTDVPDGIADKIIIFPKSEQWAHLKTLVPPDFDVAISEVLELTGELSASIQRGDSVSVQLFLQLRQEPINQLREYQTNLAQQCRILPAEDREELEGLLSGQAPAASPAAQPLQEQLQRNRALWTRVVQADRAASGRLCGKDSFYDS